MTPNHHSAPRSARNIESACGIIIAGMHPGLTLICDGYFGSRARASRPRRVGMPVGLPRRLKRRPPPTAGRQRAQAKGVTRVSTPPAICTPDGPPPPMPFAGYRSDYTARRIAGPRRTARRSRGVQGGAAASQPDAPSSWGLTVPPARAPPGRGYKAYGAVGLVSSGDRRRAQGAAVRGHVGKACLSMGATVG